MSYRERIYVGLPEAIDLIASSDFDGSHDEAWKDIKTAWREEGIVFRGKCYDGVARRARIIKIGHDGAERTRITRRDGKFYLHGLGRIGVREIDGLEMERRQLKEYWPKAMEPTGKDGSGLTASARSKGGSQSRRNPWLQDALGRIVVMLEGAGTPATFPAVWEWLEENSTPEAPYEFDPPISGCDYLYVDGDELSFKDQDGTVTILRRRSLERYMPEPSAHQN